MNNDKKMLFEAMHKVTGMPLNENFNVENVNRVNASDALNIGHNIYQEVKGLIDNQAGEGNWSDGAENAIFFYGKVLDGIRDAMYQDLGDSVNPNAGAAPDEMSEETYSDHLDTNYSADGMEDAAADKNNQADAEKAYDMGQKIIDIIPTMIEMYPNNKKELIETAKMFRDLALSLSSSLGWGETELPQYKVNGVPIDNF